MGNSNDNGQTLFEHRVSFALRGPICSFRVVSGNPPEVQCEQFTGRDPEGHYQVDFRHDTVEITEKDIENVIRIIKKHKAVFAIKELPHPLVLDGFHHTFYVSDGENCVEIHPSNVQYFLEYPESGNEEVKELLCLNEEICNYLRENGVREEFLRLT